MHRQMTDSPVTAIIIVIPSQNSVWETAQIKMGNLGAAALISADLCGVLCVINLGIVTFF